MQLEGVHLVRNTCYVTFRNNFIGFTVETFPNMVLPYGTVIDFDISAEWASSDHVNGMQEESQLLRKRYQAKVLRALQNNKCKQTSLILTVQQRVIT